MITTVAFLFIVVLPLLYGIDPTGLGKVVGINGRLLSSNNVTIAQSQARDNSKSVGTIISSPLPPPTVVESSSEEAKDTVTLTIPPKQEREYRLLMERDSTLDYSWSTDGKPIYTELRGERLEKSKGEVKNFAAITDNKASGFFIVPFAGKFGWRWQNKSDHPITVLLTTKGAYKVLG